MVKKEFKTPPIGLSVTHHIKTFHKDGTLCKEYPPIKNMITDAGLDHLASYYYSEVTRWMRIGTGTTATSRSITASQTGTTITATVGTFTIADVGRWIKFADGSQATVASYTSGTEVEATESQSIGSQAALVYNVEQTALTTQVEASNVYDANNGFVTATAGSIMTLEYKRTGKSTASYPSGATITEIGLSPTELSSLFSRLLLAEPIVIPAEGFMTNLHILTVVIDGTTQTLTAPITGVLEDATSRIGCRAIANYSGGRSCSEITAAGASSAPATTNSAHSWCCEPLHLSERSGSTYYVRGVVSDDASAITVTTDAGAVTEYIQNAITDSYSLGSFKKTMTISVNGGQFTDIAWRTIGILEKTNAYYDYRLLWDTDQVFAGGNSLTVTFTKSWKRL